MKREIGVLASYQCKACDSLSETWALHSLRDKCLAAPHLINSSFSIATHIGSCEHNLGQKHHNIYFYGAQSKIPAKGKHETKSKQMSSGSGTPLGAHQFLSPSESGCVVSALSPGGRTWLKNRLLTRRRALWCFLLSLLYSCLYFCSLATASSVAANPRTDGYFTLLSFSLSKSPVNQKAFQCCEVLVAKAANGCLGFQTF